MYGIYILGYWTSNLSRYYHFLGNSLAVDEQGVFLGNDYVHINFWPIALVS